MSDLLSYLQKECKPQNSIQTCFDKTNASSVRNLMQFFEPSHNEGSKLLDGLLSSPTEGVIPSDFKSRGKFVESDEIEVENKPVRNNREQFTENLDPLRYVDLQLEVLKQLSRKNDRFLDSIPFDPRYKPMHDAANQIRQQDRDTFRKSERNVKDALDREARYAGMSGERVTARHGDANFRRQEDIAQRYRQLEDFRRSFR